MLDRIKKKHAKQVKFLKVANEIFATELSITQEEINKDVIVFDGSTSYPPPSISPPPDVSVIISPIMFVSTQFLTLSVSLGMASHKNRGREIYEHI